MDTYTKFDFHIHSYASSKTKTGDITIVAESKIDNLQVLVDKLIQNQVNIVAITDHNFFDKDLYLKLKKQEQESNCIHKVLPGVEIDLNIANKNVHVVCIFDDSSPGHEDKIFKNFDSKDSYTIDELGALLRKIELSTVLIAHQKSDYNSSTSQKNSLSSAGKEVFYKFVGSEFFDALEIQNTKVEGILKSRFADDEIHNVNLVVGSDCHEWAYYPAHHNGMFPIDLMYMKALPTFQGLVMAVTDLGRIYSSVVPNKENTLKKISIDINNVGFNIPLSDNLNVIIGDNSVGKSTLIKHLCGEAEKAAIDFLSNHGVKILTPNLDKVYYQFSGQGKIREMFESSTEKLPIKQKFKDYFKSIDKKPYNQIIIDVLRYYGNLWDRNEKRANNMQAISRHLYVPSYIDKDKYYVSVESSLHNLENKHTEIVNVFVSITEEFKQFKTNINLMEEDDVEKLRQIWSELKNLGKKYESKSKLINIQNEIINSYIYIAQTYNENTAKHSNSNELGLNTFKSEYHKAITSICLDLEYKYSEIESCWDSFCDFKIEMSTNQVGKYCFIDKPTQDIQITKEIITSYIAKYIDISKPLEELTTSEILASIKSKRVHEKTADNLKELQNILYSNFINQFFTTTVEIKKGNDSLQESNSAGINALYYIDILSEIFSKAIFIIDQPEDDVSQSRISSDLILSLKNLSKKAQVILVTHNPQLVVNLDVDNVVILKKSENDIKFYSGPLEYKDDNYSVLDLVANTLDGGADVIKKRWKRYAKSSL